jgi:hypothetical protein
MLATAGAVLSPASSPQAASAGPLPDTTGLLTPWRISLPAVRPRSVFTIARIRRHAVRLFLGAGR